MQSFIKSVSKKAQKIYNTIQSDMILSSDLCPDNKHLPVVFSKAKSPSDVKLIIIGQDPTVRKPESRKNINTVLMLNEEKHLYKYINTITDQLGISFDSIYATNLYKCFFKIPPQDDESILTRHFRCWIELLIEEITAFPDAAVITLGQPVIKQLIHTGSKNVSYYWNYRGNSKSGEKFLSIPASNNFLQRTFYPISHLPTYNRNLFYKTYFNKYCSYIKACN